MKSILLTGGAGYIGSHTAKLLASAGYFPVALDNLSTGNEWAARWGPLIRGDIADYDLVRATLRNYNISAVIHFAASASVAESNIVPHNYFQNNVVASLAFLRALVDADVRCVVFSSSCATFGDQVPARIGDDHPQVPVNPYGESKLFIEKALKWYGNAFGMRSVALRYFNAAGADPELATGEFHNPETHLIPLALQAAMESNRHLAIYGTDYATPDGTAVRDYIHVMDLASAHLRALQYLMDGSGHTVGLNLGTGKGYSVKEVADTVRQVTGRELEVRLLDRRPGDPPSLVADPSGAAAVLNWSPRLSDLHTIVETAFRWHCSRGFRTAAGSADTARGE